ncbi:MAG TPA: hypothetical protein PLB91_10860 [Spirochaetales bacterium]|nr:hypothetical protein [Spirochaetales bacterium]HRY55086.1 hypothetical protein [Spirochaetia bacterium]HRZ64936.1 hypothetical protein [Spirochaetia bacterium]
MSIASIASFIESSRILIENARSLPEISAVLAGYGYDEARLAEGERLRAEAEALVRRQVKEYGEQREAIADSERSRAAFEAVYMRSLKVARVAFSEDALASGSLKLYGPRKQSAAGQIDQAATFYANLLADPKLAAKMRRFGYDAAKLRAESELLEALRAKLLAKAKESGEAQAATVERNAKLRTLDAWVSDLRAICKVAFYGSREELEKLGLASVPAGRRKKAAPQAAAKA